MNKHQELTISALNRMKKECGVMDEHIHEAALNEEILCLRAELEQKHVLLAMMRSKIVDLETSAKLLQYTVSALTTERDALNARLKKLEEDV